MQDPGRNETIGIFTDNSTLTHRHRSSEYPASIILQFYTEKQLKNVYFRIV